ncbi:CAP domain-containing protein [Daedaleopsis nitida]|nr:CAP domain-containing protein [Daedaleopsis nitida]
MDPATTTDPTSTTPLSPSTEATPTTTSTPSSSPTSTPVTPTESTDAPTTSLSTDASTASLSSDAPTSTAVPTTTSASISSDQSSAPSTTPDTPTTTASVTSSSGPTSTPAPPQVHKQVYLDQHNLVRGSVGASSLKWSDDLQEKAQKYAEQCQLKHSDGALGPVGENLAAATGSFSASEAVQLFTQDESDYFSNNDFTFSHFTQVVWKSTTQVGCGVALCDGLFPDQKSAATYHVCLYDPVGNVVGQEKDNLPLR